MSELSKVLVLPWPERASSAPSLPGGIALQRERLIELLAHIDGSAAAPWLGDEEALIAAYHQIGNLDFAERYEDGFRLTALGREWLESKDDESLFRVLHAKLAYVGELLTQLDGEGARVEDLLVDASRNYHLAWTSRDQVRRRLAWLHVLGLADDGPERLHVITDEGRRLLKTIEVATPEELALAMSLDGEAQLPPAPPLLARLVASADSSQRRMAIGYVPRDPLAAFSALVELAGGGIDRQELTTQLAKRFDISESSANSMVMTARTLGLHKYTGRETIAPTDIGTEWVSNATALNLVRLMHSHHLAFGEALQELGSEPISAGEIHRALFAHATPAPNQSRTAGVLRRLVDAGAAAEIGWAKFILTPTGRALLTELPMVPSVESDQSVTASDSSASAHQNSVDELINELIDASTDAGNPDRFEKATANAWMSLGVDARHIGGAGATDVLVTVRSNLAVLGRAVVDSKSAGSGQLREESVNIETLKEHAEKYEAALIAVVAPGYDNAGRLPARARSNGIVLLTARQLADIVLSHQTIPYSPKDIVDLLTVGNDADVVERRSVEEADLSLIGRVLSELQSEAAEDGAEAITARDIYRLLRKDDAVSEARIAESIQFLSHARIGAVAVNSDGGYTLPANLRVAAIRLRTLADVLEKVAASDSD